MLNFCCFLVESKKKNVVRRLNERCPVSACETQIRRSTRRNVRSDLQRKRNSRIEATKRSVVSFVPTLLVVSTSRFAYASLVPGVPGGADSTEYVETLTIEDGRMVTSAHQKFAVWREGADANHVYAGRGRSDARIWNRHSN